MVAVCRLCGKTTFLMESHIIPKFIFAWMKDTSLTGKLRSSEKVNKRVQDGLKLPWLCKNCEQKFGVWETYFAENIFYPSVNNTARVNYDNNFLKACVSISWRVLKYFIEQNHISNFPAEMRNATEKALSIWHQFLMGSCSNPGEYEQHFFNFRGKLSGSDVTSPNIHRYLQRAVDMNLIYTSKICLVYTKLPNFLLIGYIKLDNNKKWRATRVHVRHGFIQPQKYNFPKELWDYIESRSALARGLTESISDKQKTKINKSYKDQIDHVVKSETWKSLLNDIELFGEKNIFNKDDK